ncbi:MAG: hypothetical protein KKF62_06580 [Bacteroidetes bacterium]|nr:hypothetical protein [Bacteroidota bacterium]MBU1113918.1 hypothetical protein [Bacteroidota bacterium]MBU1798237.1 hypothetical protein [Bacteroidota bacterium]
MSNPKATLADKLLSAQVTIDNAIADVEIKALLADYGYDDVRLAAGKTLLDTTNQMHQVQQKEYGDQFEATNALNSVWASAKNEYMRFIKISRIALRDEFAISQKLALNSRRKESLSGWISQAKQFYLNALSDSTVLAKLAAYGITQEKLEAGKALLEETEVKNASQEKEKGEAQQATKERDNAADDLFEWLADFTVIARIALEEKPQLLEKLGIFVES